MVQDWLKVFGGDRCDDGGAGGVDKYGAKAYFTQVGYK